MPDLIPPGIYLGMSDSTYHADPALGSSKQKRLAVDPTEFQFEELHGEEKDTAQLFWGRALHVRVLEGRQAFADRYFTALNAADYDGKDGRPKALFSMNDLRTHAKMFDIKGGKTKQELAGLIRQHDEHTLIWDELVADHAKRNEGRTPIDPKIMEQIERAASWMQVDPFLAPVMTDGTFSAGFPEVSVFAEDNGVRTKARLDFLMSHAIVDLKSFRPIFKQGMERAAVRAIERERYDFQPAAYKRTIEMARPLIEAGHIFGADDDKQKEAVAKALLRKDLKWIWVLVKATGAPQPLVREFDLNSFIFKTAEMQIEDALQRYRELMAEHGPDKDWPPRRAAAILGDTEFSSFFGQ